MKIEGLVTNVTAVKSPERATAVEFPERAERATYFEGAFGVFYQFRQFFLVREPLCGVGTPSWVIITLLRVI